MDLERTPEREKLVDLINGLLNNAFGVDVDTFNLLYDHIASIDLDLSSHLLSVVVGTDRAHLENPICLEEPEEPAPDPLYVLPPVPSMPNRPIVEEFLQTLQEMFYYDEAYPGRVNPDKDVDAGDCVDLCSDWLNRMGLAPIEK
ncbi:MAG: hypothetical protein WC455_09235 [Dehalococcoidia bacterium]